MMRGTTPRCACHVATFECINPSRPGGRPIPPKSPHTPPRGSTRAYPWQRTPKLKSSSTANGLSFPAYAIAYCGMICRSVVSVQPRRKTCSHWRAGILLSSHLLVCSRNSENRAEEEPTSAVGELAAQAPTTIVGKAREIHPLAGASECLEMYSHCDENDPCTSAPLSVACGEVAQVPGSREVVSCVCP